MFRLAAHPALLRRNVYSRISRRKFSTKPEGGNLSFADILNSLDSEPQAPSGRPKFQPKPRNDEEDLDDVLSDFGNDTGGGARNQYRSQNNFGAPRNNFGNNNRGGGSNYGNFGGSRNNSDDNRGGFGGRSGYGGPRNNFGGFGSYGGGGGGGGGGRNFGQNSGFNFGDGPENPSWTPEQLAKTKKDCYDEHPELKNLSTKEKENFLKQHNITVNKPVPNPILSFSHAPFHPTVLDHLQKYEKPTPIQSLGWPIAMKGFDMVGASQTGSGKTIGFIIPAISHILAQLSHTPHQHPDGPHVLVLAPTRELAVQIAEEARPLLSKVGLRLALVYGGQEKSLQIPQIRSTPHLMVATPGRLNELLQKGMTNLFKTTFVVIDEADRMLDLGFEPQLRAIMSNVRPKPHRQVLMWSATWPNEVRSLADDFLHDSVMIQVGSTYLSANRSVKQIVHIVNPTIKLNRITTMLKNLEPDSKVLIFAATKDMVDHVAYSLQRAGEEVGTIHGGKDQNVRTQVLAAFKSGRIRMLVATDVAARGLDIKDITHVVNYDMPNDIESYIHRIGRTGRAGRTGVAISFFSPDNDTKLLRELIRVMREANQEVPQELLQVNEDSGRGLEYGRFGGGGGGGRYRR